MKIRRLRVNMRIPYDLLTWAKKYAEDRNTTLTQDYIDFLTKRKQYEESEKAGPQSTETKE